MNLSVGFAAPIETPEQGRIRAADRRRLDLPRTGQRRFLGCGPARGPHGFYRVDEWDITDRLAAGENVVAIEVAGYNANSYYLLDQPSFLQAEVTHGDRRAGLDGRRRSAVSPPVSWTTAFRRCNGTAFSGRSSRSIAWRPASTAGSARTPPAGLGRWNGRCSRRRSCCRGASSIRRSRCRRPSGWGPHGAMEKLDKVAAVWKDRSLAMSGRN